MQNVTSGRTQTVLVVDDDSDQRDVIGTHIANCGYRVLKAASADECKQALKTQQVDLVLADICLPNVDGLTLSTTLSTSPNPVAVILMSASAAYDADVIEKHGAAGFCSKQDLLRHLVPLIREVLG